MRTNRENQEPVNNSTRQDALVHETDGGDTERLKITISKETFAYLKCIQQLDLLYGLISEAIELDYGSQVDEIINDKFHDKIVAIIDEVNKYMCISINENIGGIKKFTEI
jgi:stress-induced morphogen